LLLEINSEAELAAVLGHEIVHAAARHGAKGIQRGMLLQGAVLAAAVASSDSEHAQYVVGGAALAAQLVGQKYGRNQELESDYYGMQYMSRAGYDPYGAVDLQETFLRLSEGRREDWLRGLFASHPPSRDRLKANQDTAAALPSKGRRGEREYQQQMSRLRSTKVAYEAHDEGRKALKSGNPDEAIRLANRAIEVEPEEALFYGLKGDVEFSRRRYNQAIQHYSEALRRNDGYFKYFLGRGESYRKTGRIQLARQDLANSARLLPTADAYSALGVMAEQEGELDRAIELYQAASSSATPAGRQSVQRLIALDLPRQPDRYVSTGLRLDQSGRVYVEIGNRTSVPLSRIELLIAWRDQQGTWRQQRKFHQGPIPAGQSALMLLGGGQYSANYDTLRVTTQSARGSDGP
jgi:predicted Zn-dependent protease